MQFGVSIPVNHSALETLIADHYTGGMDRLQKLCRAFVVDNDGWEEILLTRDKMQFYRRVVALTRWVSGSRYQDMCLGQLRAGQFKWWVYRNMGCERHAALDGVAIPPDHPFWATHFPRNGWDCGCEAYGARTTAGIRRVGGDPDKVLPAGWDAIDPSTGALPWVEPEFSSQVHPSFRACLQALQRGIHNRIFE